MAAVGYRALAITNTGALSQPTPPGKGSRAPWINGAKIAESGYYRALLEHGVLKSLDLFESGVETERRFRLAGKPCRRVPLKRLPAESRKHEYDAVLTEFSEIDLWTIRGRYLPRASVIAIMHAMNMQESLARIGTGLLWDLYRPHDAMVCSSETARRTLSAMFEHMREKLSRTGRGRRPRLPQLVTIPFGVDLPGRGLSRDGARSHLGFKRDDIVILSFGRLTITDKADFVAMLVPLARLARKVRPLSVKVVLAGADQDGLAAVLRRLASTMGLGRALSVYPDPSYELRSRLYAAADVFLSLSDNIQETLGLTLLEAMSHGLPVVASDWGGYRDIVIPGETGLLVPTRWAGSFEDLDGLACVVNHRDISFQIARQTSVDPSGVEASLSLLARDAALRRRLGDAGLKRVRQHFTWPVVGLRHRRLWRDLQGLRPRGGAKPATLDGLPGTHDHAAIFGHYPTRTLSDASRIAVRRDAGAGEDALPVFQIAGRETAAALKAIARKAAGGGATAGLCSAAAAKALGISRQEARAALVFGLKYGLLCEAS